MRGDAALSDTSELAELRGCRAVKPLCGRTRYSRGRRQARIDLSARIRDSGRRFPDNSYIRLGTARMNGS